MKARVAAALIVVALLVVLTLGYFWKTSSEPNGTSITFYTSTMPKAQGILQCVLSQYILYQASTGNSTSSTALETYLSTTATTMPIGATTAFTTAYTTVGGEVSNVTSCQFIAG